MKEYEAGIGSLPHKVIEDVSIGNIYFQPDGNISFTLCDENDVTHKIILNGRGTASFKYMLDMEVNMRPEFGPYRSLPGRK